MSAWPEPTFKNFLLICSALLMYSVSVKMNAWQVVHDAELKASDFADRMFVHCVTGTIECAFIAIVIILARRK